MLAWLVTLTGGVSEGTLRGHGLHDQAISEGGDRPLVVREAPGGIDGREDQGSAGGHQIRHLAPHWLQPLDAGPSSGDPGAGAADSGAGGDGQPVAGVHGADGDCCFLATRYGTSYEGQPLGCGQIEHDLSFSDFNPGEHTLNTEEFRRDGLYHSADPSILAVGPARYGEWPCGRRLRVCTRSENHAGESVVGQVQEVRCLDVVRVDSCPGCGPNHIDLSESGIAHLCGYACDRIDGLTLAPID